MTARAPRPARELPIERATLIKIARDTAAERLAARRSLLSAYLTGAVAAGEPLLGEATDIDLVLIDSAAPPVERELVRLTEQVILDIQHRPREVYANARALRVHPWLGPELAEPLLRLAPAHFFELAQASARGQFHRPENVAARARGFAAWARRELHIGPLPGAEPDAPVSLAGFTQALLYAANAAMTLTGFPAAGRRLVLKLDGAARRLGQPGLYTDFLALFSGAELDSAASERFLAGWSAAYRLGHSSTNELIHPARRSLYERGFRAQIQADRAADSLWLMTATWHACRDNVPAGNAAADQAWSGFLEHTGLAPGPDYDERVAQAVAYVDTASALVEAWAAANGA